MPAFKTQLFDMEKAEAAVVEIVKSILPRARKAMKSVTKSISGRK